MRTITVSVQDEIMQLSSNNAGAAGSYGVVTLEISFGNGWADMAKKLYFYDAYGENLVYILLGPDNLKEGETDVYVVPIPAEPLALQGDMTLTIKGSTIDGESVEHVIYTASKKLKVMDSAYSDVDGGEPAEPTDTQAAQLEAQIDALTTLIQNGGLTIGGEYVAETAYAALTIVGYEGSSYVTLKAVVGVTPTDDGINYRLIAEKGDIGVTGAKGDTGAQGPEGPAGPAGGQGLTGAPGVGISSIALISGTHAPGTTDTYRITLTNAVTADYTVYNGANGTGDMTKAVYDPTGKNQDAFAYADSAASIAGLTAETTIADTDYFVFNDVSVAGGVTKRKTLWSNIKAKLKTYFDTLYMALSGGTFTGAAIAQANTSYTTAQLRNVILSTSDPTGGNNGDIWIKYTP